MAFEGGPKTPSRRALELKEKALKEARGEEVQDTGPTIGQLLENDEDSRLVAQMIETKGTKDSAGFLARIQTGEASESEKQLMENYRNEYVDLRSRERALNETIDKRIAEFREKSPKFNAECAAWGQDGYLSVLKQGLLEVAVTKPAEFKKIEEQLAHVAKSEKDIDDPANPYNKRLVEFQAKYNLSDETLTSLMTEIDPAKRTEQIQQVYREEMGFIRRYIDSRAEKKGKNSSRSFAKFLSDSIDGQQESLEQHMSLIDKSGGALAALVSGNPQLRKALLTMKPGEDPKLINGVAETIPFSEARIAEVNSEDLKNTWTRFLDHEGIDNFAGMPTDRQEIIENRFAKRYAKEKAGSGKGLWARAMEWLFAANVARELRSAAHA